MAARSPHTRRWTRRQFLEATGGLAAVGYLAAACGPAAPPSATSAPAAAATTAPAVAAATTAPAAAATTAPAVAATTAPVAARAGGQAIISFGEPDTLLMSE